MVLRNSLAHLIARLAGLGAGIAVIPLVTLTLGTEALGLVGIYASLQAMTGLLDLGLPMAANHRLAVMIGRKAHADRQAELIRSVETVFWLLVALFLAAGLALVGPLADSWLNVTQLSRETVNASLAMAIAATAIRFPIAFYTNVLFAFDRHLFPNAVTTASAIARILASAIALIWLDVGIVGFFVIQLTASVAEVLILAGGVWLAQPRRWLAPQWAVLRDLASVAGGLTLISVTAVVLSQIDKVILAKLLSLGDFGIYSAAYTLATGLVALSYPIGNAVFPQLSRALDARGGDASRTISVATELTILVIVPIGCVAVAQTEPLLRLLFIIKPVPETLVAVLPLMVLGGIAQAFVTLPHLYQVAAGRIATVVWINAGLMLPYAVLVLFSAHSYGIFGGAFAFAVLNALRLLAHWIVIVIHARRAETPAWQHAIVLTGVSVAGGIAVAEAPTLLKLQGFAAMLVALVSVAVLFLLAAVAMPQTRARSRNILRRGFTH